MDITSNSFIPTHPSVFSGFIAKTTATISPIGQNGIPKSNPRNSEAELAFTNPFGFFRASPM